MAGKFATSWNLFKSSWNVLKADKELAVIPVMSAVCSLVVVAVMGVGLFLTARPSTGLRLREAGGQIEATQYSATPLTYVVGVVGYVALSVVITFFAGVLVAGAYQRLTGGDPTLASAFSAAAKRFPQLLLWSLLVATVGLILNAVKERSGFLGDLVANLVGAALEIVTWLAVPVIVVEGTGPLDSLKRSANLFKKTWGENLIAQGGFGLAGLVVMLPGLVISAAVIAVLPLVGAVMLVAYVALVTVLLSALSGIYRTALYMFASTGEAPGFFDQSQLVAAFGPKR
ncbi:MAG: DUF6159 family protein [Acidimicrobiales bacterium]|nr:DUF6159 family protein [Acidimicrobiales bacterium]